MRDAVKTLAVTYAAEPDSVPRARSTMRAFADGLGASAEQVDAIRLAVSEAVTNVVRHAYRDRSGEIHLTAALVSDELWILVSDDGCGLEPRTNRPGLGLGLGLISQVSDHLAIVDRASGGTEVRMRFDLDDERSGERRASPAMRSRGTGSRKQTPHRRETLT
jgi:serine/threonine-protein kinase RsbW